MQLKTNHSDFIRFLKDEKFIVRQLCRTDEPDEYWEEFLRQFPGERENIESAEKHFRQIKLSSHKLSQERKHDAVARLEHSLRTYNRRRSIRRFTRVAAACAVILLLSVPYIQKKFDRSISRQAASADYIVGSESKSKDIVFISGNKITSFRKNIDIEIQNSKTARITAGNSKNEIALDRNAMNKVIVPYGKQSKIVLPDGTRVWLNSGSSLEFLSAFTGNTREVRLSGEMYVEAAPDKNKPFYVHISDFSVKVYGTKFNVSDYSCSLPSVVLVEGSVALQTSDKRELLLSPDEQAVYAADGTFHTRKVAVTPFISWKDGYLTFQNTPVMEVLKQIERYYNLSFNYDKDFFQGLTCSGKIILSNNLDNVLTAFGLISSTKYRKEDNLIYISK